MNYEENYKYGLMEGHHDDDMEPIDWDYYDDSCMYETIEEMDL